MKNFFNEFRQFAMRGNVADMAVGIIIGGAFGKIVSSLVNDIIMPPLGWIIGGVDFSDLALTLPVKAENGAAVMINYGQFVQVTFDFLIIAFAIFLVIKGLNRLSRQEKVEEEQAPPPPSKEEVLLSEIRDILKTK
jgi:large conductance mechanosensitive channel